MFLLSYGCFHDALIQSFTPVILPRQQQLLKQHTRSPIRIEFDLSTITEGIDQAMCMSAGQHVNWTYTRDQNYTCTSDDIMTPAKVAFLQDTFASLKAHYESLFSVTRYPESYNLSQISDVKIKERKIDDIDLIIAVAARPFPYNPSYQAGAFAAIFDPDGRRPLGGVMYLNSAVVPIVPQNLTSVPRTFYELIAHETMHVLGISTSLFNHWIDPATEKAYGEALPWEEYNHSGRVFNILHTPHAHELAARRFCQSEFFKGVPAGIEMEDGGGSGTAYSHLEMRVYFNELMQGVHTGTAVFSDVSLALLEDTGWYDVNKSAAEPYYWGANVADFATKSPTDFPDAYLCRDSSRPQCAYDLAGPAYCLATHPVDCATDQKFCQARDFYDPRNETTHITNDVVDYMPVKLAYKGRLCGDSALEDATKRSFGETYGHSSKCAISSLSKTGTRNATAGCYEMRCSKDTLFIRINGVEQKCQKNKLIQVAGYDGSLECPDPAVACHFTPTHNKQSKMMILYIGLASLGGLLVITLVVFLIMCRIKRKEPSAQESSDMTVTLIT